MHTVLHRTALLRVLAPVILLAACTNVPAAGSAGNEPSGSAGVQPSAASPSSEHGFVGRNGSIAWRVTAQGLSLSQDVGRTFAQVPLPSSVAPSAIVAVNAVPGTTWLVSRGLGRSITVYARGSASALWSAGALLTPTWPANLGGAEEQPPSVWITPGGPKQVLVMTQLVLTHSVSIPRLFVSRDGGVTFAQRVQPAVSDLNTTWAAIALSGTSAVAVIGERLNQVIYSGDTGSTWAPSTVRGVPPPGADFVVGTPVFTGSTIYLPVTDLDTGAFVLLRSTDGGAEFDSFGAQTLPTGTFVGEAPPPVAAAGAAWWVVSPMTGSVYRSTDDGMTWSTAAATLPQGVVDIAATDSQNATVTIEHNSCATGKTGCSSDQYAETTSNGGRTWSRI